MPLDRLWSWLIRFSALAGLVLLLSAAYIPLKAALAQALLSQTWAHSLETGQAQSPWPSMDARPIVRLSIPHLGHSDIVMDSATGQALAFGPAHMPKTSSPGKAGLSVIAAHKNTHFDYVKELNIGDLIEIETLNRQQYQFKITHFEIVDKDESGIEAQSYGKARLALVTCYPFDALSYGGPLRYVVFASKVSPDKHS